MYEKFLALTVVFLVGVLLASMLFPSGRKGTEFYEVECKALVATTDPIYKKVNDVSPIGSIVAFGGTQAPTGWAMCNGTLVLIDGTYNELYKVIGKNFGASGPVESPTHFNLPDLRGVFLRGVDGDINRDPDKNTRRRLLMGGNEGNNVGSYQEYDVQNHSHPVKSGIYYNAGGGGGRAYGGWSLTTDNSYPVTPDLVSPVGGSETRPRNVAVNYIIRFA